MCAVGAGEGPARLRRAGREHRHCHHPFAFPLTQLDGTDQVTPASSPGHESARTDFLRRNAGGHLHVPRAGRRRRLRRFESECRRPPPPVNHDVLPQSRSAPSVVAPRCTWHDIHLLCRSHAHALAHAHTHATALPTGMGDGWHECSIAVQAPGLAQLAATVIFSFVTSALPGEESWHMSGTLQRCLDVLQMRRAPQSHSHDRAASSSAALRAWRRRHACTPEEGGSAGDGLCRATRSVQGWAVESPSLEAPTVGHAAGDQRSLDAGGGNGRGEGSVSVDAQRAATCWALLRTGLLGPPIFVSQDELLLLSRSTGFFFG